MSATKATLEPCPNCQETIHLALTLEGDKYVVTCTNCNWTGPASDSFTNSQYSTNIARTTARRRWNKAARQAKETNP